MAKDMGAGRGSRGAWAVAVAAALALFFALATPVCAAPWDGRTYPSSYDLRDEGRVSPVRSQDGFSTCWVMAPIRSLESNLLPSVRLDFSENHMANFQSSTLDYEGRASNLISAAYFARWEGPVLERDDPYPRPDDSPEGLSAVRHVQEILTLPPRAGFSDNAAIKWAVMEEGAVAASLYWDREWMDYDTFGYFYSDGGMVEPTHWVSIVGWDDDYPAENFVYPARGNGAFLIKNSWGTDWGDLAGYFWVSYYDTSLGSELMVDSGVEGAGNYDAIYQYDPLAWSKNIGFGSETAWFANRFRAAGKGTLAAVSFYTPSPGATYEVRVAATVAGIATTSSRARGSLAVAGYHTVKLTRPAALKTGKRFVVAVRLTTPGSDEPIPLEHPWQLSSPSAARGQSYVSADGTKWTDLVTVKGFERSNVCLKALVDGNGRVDDEPPRVDVAGFTVKAGKAASIAFRVTDPAFSSASVNVRLVVKTAKGRTIKTRRVAGVCVGESRTWRFTAKMVPGKYRVEARGYDVAGNSQATPRRAILIVR